MTCDETDRTGNLLGALALAVTDKIRDVTARATGQGGMVPAALVQVGSEAGQSIDHLSRRLGLSHSASVRVVMQMEAKGWLTKSRTNEKDARMAKLHLTMEGQAAMAQILAQRRTFLQSLVGPLTRVEQENLTALLETILSRAVQTDDEAEQVCRLCDLSSCPQDRCPTTPPIEQCVDG